MNTDRRAALTLKVRVIPRAGRTAVAGMRGDSVVVRLAAAPVDGAANSALLDFLAEVLGVSTSNLTIVSGERNRDKRIAVGGLTADQIQQKIPGWSGA
jgi:uncharacterized protein (TIGR00251 family)